MYGDRYAGVFFFFQAEDGIRDYKVTGVQTCALPIWKTANGRPVAASHRRAVQSADPVATIAPSRLKAIAITGAECPESTAIVLPWGSQIRAVRSSEALAKRDPSGPTATAFTLAVWPLQFSTINPLWADHTCTSFSTEPTAHRPEGCMAKERGFPAGSGRKVPVCVAFAHTATSPDSEPV